MLVFIIILVIAWFMGVWGWSQVIGSLQNISAKPSLAITFIVWLAILGVLAYIAIPKFSGTIPLLIGYAVALLQVLFSGKIE